MQINAFKFSEFILVFIIYRTYNCLTKDASQLKWLRPGFSPIVIIAAELMPESFAQRALEINC